ncbi:unnamed protein product [Phytophthora lilii]|uniref:Unnamed protein product n=1 Tax=Phytophthora lilii TaxID=2077276 RepID=A0A9W6TSG6_9STRA|nr:unnamed protein product [Phytophthora lilii]
MRRLQAGVPPAPVVTIDRAGFVAEGAASASGAAPSAAGEASVDAGEIVAGEVSVDGVELAAGVEFADRESDDEGDSVAGDSFAAVVLLEAIFDMKRYKERYSFDASALTLYLAKKDGAWLKHDRTVKNFLQAGKRAEYEEMLSSWKLDDDEYFKKEFQPGDKEIHILVELPAQVAAPSDVIPSLPPTSIHRHPERLKRWAAINAMIRQKTRDANQKTTSEDAKNTNKKWRNHDIDKSVGYSTLCWEDIKPIYNFDDSYDLQPSDIPDADIELLLARIRDLRELYGQISDGKEAKRLLFIAPILETVSRLLGDVRILRRGWKERAPERSIRVRAQAWHQENFNCRSET